MIPVRYHVCGIDTSFFSSSFSFSSSATVQTLSSPRFKSIATPFPNLIVMVATAVHPSLWVPGHTTMEEQVPSVLVLCLHHLPVRYVVILTQVFLFFFFFSFFSSLQSCGRKSKVNTRNFMQPLVIGSCQSMPNAFLVRVFDFLFLTGPRCQTYQLFLTGPVFLPTVMCVCVHT